MRFLLERRGNALVLSVFMLLALTSVGIVAVQRTKTDMIVSGNLTQADTADAVGQGGASLGIFTAMEELDRIKVLFRHNPLVTTTGKLVPVFIGGKSTAAPSGASDHLPIVVPNDSTYLSVATFQQRVAYDFMLIPLGSIIPKSGSGLDQFCLEKWEILARGGIPKTESETLADTLGPTDDFYRAPTNSTTVIIRSRARGIFGPTRCENTGRY